MNITWVQLKGVVQELRNIHGALLRLAECWEAELSEQGINMRPTSNGNPGKDTTITYTNEEEDFVREMLSAYKKEEEDD